MSDIKKTKKNKVETNVKKQPIVQTYTKKEILEGSDAFGESPEVIAGSLRLVNKDELSKAEVESAVRKFKTRKVL